MRGEYTIADTGEKVTLSKVGAKKVTSHSMGNEAHLKSIAAIPDLLKHAVFIEDQPNEKGNGKYDTYRYYVVGLKIGGLDYTARLTIGVKDGKYYYDHNLTEIEKGNLIEIANGFTPTGDAPVPSYTEGKDKRLLSLLQTNASKVVDENGEPLVVYHGTSADFWTFRRTKGKRWHMGLEDDVMSEGFFFSPDKSFSESYSSNSQRHRGGKSKIMACFLNIRKPLDLADPSSDWPGLYEDATGFEYVVGMDRQDNLWGIMDEEGMAERLKSKGYDGAIFAEELNEQYEPTQISYCAFEPSQIKSATDNTGAFSAEDKDIRYRNGGGDRSLVAVHNLSVDKLEQALELGGFPMPSIAVTKADVGHTEFGEISLLFHKETIDPADRRNKVYGEDAWTPTFPSVGYKLNDKKTDDIYRRANKAGSLPLFNPVTFHPDNYERHIIGLGSESLVKQFKEDYGAKQLFLSEQGNAVKEFEQHEVDKYLPDQIALSNKLLDEIGLERLKGERNDALEEVKRIIAEQYGIDFSTMKPFVAKKRISNTISRAIDYAENGNKETVNDIEATKKKIDEKDRPRQI